MAEQALGGQRADEGGERQLSAADCGWICTSLAGCLAIIAERNEVLKAILGQTEYRKDSYCRIRELRVQASRTQLPADGRHKDDRWTKRQQINKKLPTNTDCLSSLSFFSFATFEL